MTALSWSDVAALYPDGLPLVLFDRDIAPQMWNAVLKLRLAGPMGEPGQVWQRKAWLELWADDAACMERVGRLGLEACRCVVWSGGRWRTLADHRRRIRIREQFRRVEGAERHVQSSA